MPKKKAIKKDMDMLLSASKLALIINEEFSVPFIEHGRVTADYDPEAREFYITIGPRNIAISEDCTVVDAGTFIGIPPPKDK